MIMQLFLIFAGFLASCAIVGLGFFKLLQALASAFSDSIEEIDTDKDTNRLYNYTVKAKSEITQSTNKIYSVSKTQDSKSNKPKTNVVEPANKSFTIYSEDKLKKTAERDALNGEYQVLYSQSEKNKEIYNSFYKSFRKNVISQMARRDASAIHNYTTKQHKAKPTPEGNKLSVPAEVFIYQDIFVKEISALKEQHQQMMKDKELMLQELYGQEVPAPIDQEKFYKSF